MPSSDSTIVRSKLESILFAAGKPLSLKKLAELTGVTVGDVEGVLAELQRLYREGSHGLEIILHQGEAVLATHPDHSELVREFLKKEEYGELTRPQLEALSVLAYRGPLVRSELEQVRGVNCSLILRNLMIRGLVEESGTGEPTRYQVTVEFLQHLGLTSLHELPHFDELSRDANLAQVVAAATKPTESSPELAATGFES